jgi:hypothetical protein
LIPPIDRDTLSFNR